MRCVVVIVILSVRLSQLFENLQSYANFQRQKCSPWNAVSGSVRFMQIFAGVRWRGGINVDVANGNFRFFHSQSSEHFTYMTAFTWCECRWPWRYFKVIRLFHIKFLKNGMIRQKLLQTTNRNYTSFRLVPLLMTLNDIWKSFHPPSSNISEISTNMIRFDIKNFVLLLLGLGFAIELGLRLLLHPVQPYSSSLVADR